MAEYRPRIRPNRKHPVTRKGNVVLVVCDTDDLAVHVEALVSAALRDVPAPAAAGPELYAVPGLGRQEA